MADNTSTNEANLPHPDDTPDIPAQSTIREDSGNVDEAHETRGDEARPSSPDEKPLEVTPTPPNDVSAVAEVSFRLGYSIKD